MHVEPREGGRVGGSRSDGGAIRTYPLGYSACDAVCRRNFHVAPAVTTALRYDTDYPLIPYGEHPDHNAIARLQERLDKGETHLKFAPGRGYLDSLLQTLGIDPSSQTLVYSKTSLQIDLIRAATPRAIYFDDDTYIAWIPARTSSKSAPWTAPSAGVLHTS